MQNPLIDNHSRHHRYLRIAVTERCNLRCRYCMPAEGMELSPREHILTFDEIVRFAALCAKHGVDKIRLTGGEPLVRRKLPDLVRRLRSLPGIDTVALTTNGTLLDQHIGELVAAGLDAVNISLDTLDPSRFMSITRRDDHAAVLRGLQAALASGIGKVKVNTVVIRGVNDDELDDFVELTRDAALDVRFIEFMPFDANAWSPDAMLTGAEMLERIRSTYEVRAQSNGAAVAQLYAVPGFKGRVGFISSMSRHFCDGCDRLRLTADGALKACLFSRSESNIRTLLRENAPDETMESVLKTVLGCKWRHHPGGEALADMHNRSMIQIGG